MLRRFRPYHACVDPFPVTLADDLTPRLEPVLDAAQRLGRGDMPSGELRAALHAAAELVAGYLASVEEMPVLPPVVPGQLTAALDGPPPSEPVPFAVLLEDARRLILPNVTHWQHPGFLGYFPSSGAAAGIAGELLMAGLISNAMLWRTSPVATELEAITVRWLREGLGLPDAFDGLYTDTASTSSLVALAAAREVASPGASRHGIAAGPRLRVYASEEAHSSIDKAAMTLGIGRDGVRRIVTDDAFSLRPDALRAAIAEDRAAGWRPVAVVATIGTTSSTGVDPVGEVADICAAEGLWLHVDAAYAGVVALLPELRHHVRGWERADSIVVNPHKWLFTPLDCSLLLSRRLEALRETFSLVPEYLRTTGPALGGDPAQAAPSPGRDYNEYIPQLGRRARGIKMWLLLRYFGLPGLAARIEDHIRMAGELAGWIDAEPDAERLAPAPFSTVCFRWRPAQIAGRVDEPAVGQSLDDLNERLLARLNAGGEVFLSHTRLRGRFTIRASIGNLRTERSHLERLWQLVQEHGRDLAADVAW
jgi:aromatic-L-amino-acid/L-tryptophan decarboxylase